jgi:hypothetical protein
MYNAVEGERTKLYLSSLFKGAFFVYQHLFLARRYQHSSRKTGKIYLTREGGQLCWMECVEAREVMLRRFVRFKDFQVGCMTCEI